MNFHQLPEEMKSISNWVLVKLIPKKDGRFDKVPVGIKNGIVHDLSWAKSNNRLPFEVALDHYQQEQNKEPNEQRFHGLGFVLNDTDFMCVDLDKAFAGSDLKPFAREIIASLNGFVEKSVSGNGLHIYIKKSSWSLGTKRGKFLDGSGIDVLCPGSYVMVTGDTIENASYTIGETQDFTVLQYWREQLNSGNSEHLPGPEEVPFDHNIPVAGWTVERIRDELLPRIKDFEDRDSWRDVCFALHHQTQGSDEGLELFHEYSARLPELYNPKEVDELWRSTKLNPNKLNKTFRWLLSLVRAEIVEHKSHLLGDVDNARLFRATFEGEFLYCHSNSRWLRFTGLRWEWCQKGEEIGAAKVIAEMLIEKAAELFKLDPSGPISKSWMIHAKNTRNNGRLIAMLQLAASEPGMSIANISELDAKPMLLGVQNGVLDLKEMVLLPGDPALLTSRQANVSYNPAATCPLWLKFIHQTFLGDQGVIDYIQKALGYSLTGDVSEELLHFCFGHGRNGKSVMANIIVKIMGDYVQIANFDLLAVKESGASNDIARLAGVRLVMANETRENQRLDDQKLKVLVSTEKITARFMYGEFFEFWPQFKIWLRGNYKPIITDSSNGAWRRIRLLPFENQIPEDQIDYKLEEKLLAEKEGIFAWMVDGCNKWQQERLNPPKRIEEASRIYKEESDLLAEFMEDRCVVGHGMSIDQKVLYWSYKSWCSNNGVHPLAQKSLTRQLSSRGFDTQRMKVKGENARFYLGLSVTPELIKSYEEYCVDPIAKLE